VLRATIYSRYSTDNQRDDSVEDQTAICSELIAREGWVLAIALADEALRTEAFEILRSLIKAVVLHPAGETGQGYEIELVGEIARMVVTLPPIFIQF
jgi:hypothetical protein